MGGQSQLRRLLQQCGDMLQTLAVPVLCHSSFLCGAAPEGKYLLQESWSPCGASRVESADRVGDTGGVFLLMATGNRLRATG